MSLLQRVKTDWVEARKAKAAQKANLLTLVIAGAESRAKDDKKAPNREVVDADVTAEITKLMGNLKEYFVKPEILSRMSEDDKLLKQLEIDQLQSYLPKQMTQAELRSTVEELKNSMGEKFGVGQVMAYFKKTFADGSYDRAVVSALTQGLIKK